MEKGKFIMMTVVNENLSFEALGTFAYSLSPVSASIQEVAELEFYRESDQLLRTKSQGAVRINIADWENNPTDIENNFVHYQEAVIINVKAKDEEEALHMLNIQVNEVNLNDAYITLYDFEGKPYLFSIFQTRINWDSAEINLKN